MAQIAITGASGFVGHALVRLLSAEGHSLRCLVRDAPPTSLAALNKIVWIRGSLEHKDCFCELLAGCDSLVHAALYRTSSSFRGPENDLQHYLAINLLGTVALFEAAVAEQLRRVIFVSTCAVHEHILADRPLDETHPTSPHTHYGAHKAALENFVHSFAQISTATDRPGTEFCALRPSGIYGLQPHWESSKWHELVRSISLGKDVSADRGGKEVHVSDVAKAIVLLLDSAKQVNGEIFNCTDRFISEHEVATFAREICQSPSQILGPPKIPKNQIQTGKLRALGMEFGGTPLLKNTIRELVQRIQCP